MRTMLAITLVLVALPAPSNAAARWPPQAWPVIRGTDGYIPIPGAAVTGRADRTYRAVFDASRGAGSPGELVPALNMLGSELNVFGGSGVPAGHLKFAIVFHGGALDAILDDAHYRAKHGVANPNLPVIAALRKAGVELFVCGQNLAFENIDRKTLTPDVRVALDALVVLIAYQNDGYALMSF